VGTVISVACAAKPAMADAKANTNTAGFIVADIVYSPSSWVGSKEL
jgi:hypothetical protein